MLNDLAMIAEAAVRIGACHVGNLPRPVKLTNLTMPRAAMC
jgi:hypothetical protein